MTKSVRIENADNSSYKVVVEVWQKSGPLAGADAPQPYILVETIRLDHPTALAVPYITADRYLVVKEG